MQPESRKLLADMREAADAIAAFTSGKSLADLANDPCFVPASTFSSSSSAKACPSCGPRMKTRWSESANTGEIIGFRNQIVHGYAKIDDEITWRIVQDKLPVSVPNWSSC